MTPVDYVARATAALATAPLDGLTIHALHSPSGDVSMGLIVDALRARGIHAEPATPATWQATIASLPDASLPPALRRVLATPEFGAWGQPVEFDNAATAAWLRERNIVAPPAELLLRSVLDWFEAVRIVPGRR